MDANNPNDYYAIGKLVCNKCPVWKKCAEAGSSEVWGMWGGLTPQERKGTVRVSHGSREMHRLGCDCAPCAKAEEVIAKDVPLEKIPAMGVSFDSKSLLYDLLNS